MAIYHLSVKAISRSAGRSVVAAAAYRSGVALIDERQGIAHDYTRKQGVAAAFVVAPDGAEWALDRERLWNAAEAAENRKDAKTGREYELARQAAIRLEMRRQAERWATEEARKAAELERQKQRQKEADQGRSRGLSRGRSRSRDYDGPGMGF